MAEWSSSRGSEEEDWSSNDRAMAYGLALLYSKYMIVNSPYAERIHSCILGPNSSFNLLVCIRGGPIASFKRKWWVAFQRDRSRADESGCANCRLEKISFHILYIRDGEVRSELEGVDAEEVWWRSF